MHTHTHIHTAGHTKHIYICMNVSLFFFFSFFYCMLVFGAFSVNLAYHASKVQRARAPPDFVVESGCGSDCHSHPLSLPPSLFLAFANMSTFCRWLARNAASFA